MFKESSSQGRLRHQESRLGNRHRRRLSRPKPAWRKPRHSRNSADKHITQTKANLTRAADVLDKTTYAAPFDGIVTNLPVREGETVVIGIQNSPRQHAHDRRDMSVIHSRSPSTKPTFVNVRLGQSPTSPSTHFRAGLQSGSLPIGDNALVGLHRGATSQSIRIQQEAKDFKVTVTLTSRRPIFGPACRPTAKITTATSPKALTIPIQALTMRDPSDLVDEKDRKNRRVPPGATRRTRCKRLVIRDKKIEIRARGNRNCGRHRH